MTDRQILVQRVYEARKTRRIHPHGEFDRAGRWYPDTEKEGGTPPVRTPSRRWPYSYLKACRTLKWVRQLPDETLKEDAAGLS